MARDYEIQKPSGACSRCGRELAAGEGFTVALFETDEGFRRDDLCDECSAAQGGESGEPFSLWQSRVPTPEEPKQRFVGNDVLMDFFEKLDGQDDPAKVNFRFVLALMLMRKKLLVYDASRRDESGGEVWTMHYRHGDTAVEVIHPEMDDDQIAQVTAELGAIFEVQS